MTFKELSTKEERNVYQFPSLLHKEKELHETLHQILPEEIANSLSPKSSTLTHLYGLPKTHKASIRMRPTLAATGTYSYNLAKCLEQKLKPLSLNENTIADAFAFADEIRTHSMNEDDILVSYDVRSFHQCTFRRDYQNLSQQRLH